MKIKIVLGSIIVVIAVFGTILANQFAVLPWSNDDLPKMEKPNLVVTKSARTLEVFDGAKLIKTFSIALGSSPVGDKEVEGDGKTPEGEFYVFTKNSQSSFYLSLGLSYPNAEDAARGLASELISQEEHDEIVAAIAEKRMPLQKTRLGGEIYIHGNGNLADWTAGCVALSNSDMKALFDALPIGTPVKIVP